MIKRPSFVYWIVPHLLACLVSLLSYIGVELAQPIIQYSFVATMCEQGMMLFLAVAILDLPTVVFQSAFLLMLYERTLATIGGSLLLMAITRIYPELRVG